MLWNLWRGFVYIKTKVNRWWYDEEDMIRLKESHDYMDYIIDVYNVKYEGKYYTFSKIYIGERDYLRKEELAKLIDKCSNVISVTSDRSDITRTFKQFIGYFDVNENTLSFTDEIKEYLDVHSLMVMTKELDVVEL